MLLPQLTRGLDTIADSWTWSVSNDRNAYNTDNYSPVHSFPCDFAGADIRSPIDLPPRTFIRSCNGQFHNCQS